MKNIFEDIKSLSIIIFIILISILCINLVSCATKIVPVVNKITFPNIKPCPDLILSTPNTWAMDILQRTQDYQICKAQTDAIIIFIREINK